jgi:hypothetical protein
LVPGYPLFGKWVHPIRAFADQNHDDIIEGNEISIGDSLVYVGQPDPKYNLSFNTDVHVGRLSAHAVFTYQDGMTQTNLAALNSASFMLLGNNPGTPLAYQAAIVATGRILSSGLSQSTTYGLIQTVDVFRFQSLSINYSLPQSMTTRLKIPRATIALQGSNLGLHSNYRGKDPSVNAFSTVSSGDQTADLGQIPVPRTWQLTIMLGN